MIFFQYFCFGVCHKLDLHNTSFCSNHVLLFCDFLCYPPPPTHTHPQTYNIHLIYYLDLNFLHLDQTPVFLLCSVIVLSDNDVISVCYLSVTLRHCSVSETHVTLISSAQAPPSLQICLIHPDALVLLGSFCTRDSFSALVDGFQRFSLF